jgi:cytochrome c-type biogenesis protein CcmH/NrfG
LDSKLSFFAAAAALVGVMLAVLLPFVWRGMRRHETGPGHHRRTVLAVVGVGLCLPLLAFVLYALRGDLGALGEDRQVLSEQLLAGGLPEDAAQAEQLYAELQRHLQKATKDPRALVLKARLDMRAQRYDLAVGGFEQAVALSSRVARDPAVWVEYAEATGLQQGGTLVGKPQELVAKALAIDANHVQALDLAGSAAFEVRDFAKAVIYWKRLLEQTPPGSLRHAELSKAIERAEQRGRFALPP